jgi:Flp pilus assembly protein TadG
LPLPNIFKVGFYYPTLQSESQGRGFDNHERISRMADSSNGSPTMITRNSNRNSRRGVAAVEAAIVMPVLIITMFGVWEVGRLIQVNQVVVNSAREGARLAAGAYVNGTPVTVAMVQQAVRDYMRASGLPAAAYNGATITLTCLASPTWVNPSDALPLDRFTVQVSIPTGAAFNSMLWSLVYRLSAVNQMSVTVNWVSCTDAKIAVSSVLPY